MDKSNPNQKSLDPGSTSQGQGLIQAQLDRLRRAQQARESLEMTTPTKGQLQTEFPAPPRLMGEGAQLDLLTGAVQDLGAQRASAAKTAANSLGVPPGATFMAMQGEGATGAKQKGLDWLAPDIAPGAADKDQLARLTGTVGAIRHENADDDFYIFRLQPLGTSSPRDQVSVKGHGVALKVGMEIMVQGQWVEHPQYGRQLEKSVTTELMPVSSDGIRKLLSSGFVKGIGAEFADKLLKRFGNKLFDVAEKKPELLREVDGVGPKRIDALVAAVKEKRALPRIMTFLVSVDLGPQLSHRVFRALGSGAVEIIKRNPYELTQVPMIGFGTADRVARALGVPLDSERRIVSAMEAALEKAGKNGSTALPVEALKTAIFNILSIKEEGVWVATTSQARIDEVVEAQINDSSTIIVRMLRATVANGGLSATTTSEPEPEPEFVRCASLKSLALDEKCIARHLARLSQRPVSPALARADLSSSKFAHLDESQLAATRTSLCAPVSIITGRPGCGKTTVTKSIIDAMEAAGLTVLLMAPTGMAAKRMSKATGRKATTVHRALQSTGKVKFLKDENNPLEADVIFVDEYSMMETRLTERLLRAVKTGTQLVMVGDRDQLPSIGAGNVFSDMIASGVLAVSVLSKIHRQAENSAIKSNSHLIVNGLVPQPPKPGQDNDFELINCTDRDKQVQSIVENYQTMLKRGFASEDIQVLTPMRQAKDPLSSMSLNNVLKDMLNPVSRHGKNECIVKSSIEGVVSFSPGDRVMQLATNKDKDLSNGDVGYIIDIDKEGKTMLINFDDEVVEITSADVDDLDLAYASTVHKSQGSEYEVVIIPISRGHGHMFDRGLLYTAESRGKKFVSMVGDLYTLKKIVEKINSAKRITGLQDEIALAFEGYGAGLLAKASSGVPRFNRMSQRM